MDRPDFGGRNPREAWLPPPTHTHKKKGNKHLGMIHLGFWQQPRRASAAPFWPKLSKQWWRAQCSPRDRCTARGHQQPLGAVHSVQACFTDFFDWDAKQCSIERSSVQPLYVWRRLRQADARIDVYHVCVRSFARHFFAPRGERY